MGIHTNSKRKHLGTWWYENTQYILYKTISSRGASKIFHKCLFGSMEDLTVRNSQQEWHLPAICYGLDELAFIRLLDGHSLNSR